MNPIKWEPYEIEHDKYITKEKGMLKEYFIDSVHLTGIPNDSDEELLHPTTKWFPLHFRITLECNPRPKEKIKADAGDRKAKKKEEKKSSKVQGSKVKEEKKVAEDTLKKPIFVVVDQYPHAKDIARNNNNKDVPQQIFTILKTYAHSYDALEDTKFTFPFAQNFKGKISVAKYLSLLKEEGRLRYRTDKEGNGCLHYAITLLSDMKNKNWLEDSDLVKKNFATISLWKKGTKIGEDYYISYGIGTFF